MLFRLFRSLRHRDFRVYYLSQLVSLTGTWMQNMAQAWLVYRLTGSGLMLGTVAFASLGPVLLFGIAAGSIADRVPRRTLLLAAQSLALLQALALAGLTLSGRVEPWHIVVLALVLGVVHALEMPARHALVGELVPGEDLPNAVALNAALFNSARFLGPALAGALVALSGEGAVFLINAATFAVLIVGLALLHGGREVAARHRGLDGIGDGLRFALKRRPVRNALLLLMTISLAGTGHTVLMPIFSVDVFGGGPELLGKLMGAAGAGALTAALRMAWLNGRQNLQQQIAVASFGIAVGLALFAAAGSPELAMMVLAFTGFALTSTVASVNTLLQTTTPRELKGRVMALFSVLFLGVTSLGNLLAGALADTVGPRTTVVVFATATMLSVLGYWRSVVAARGSGID